MRKTLFNILRIVISLGLIIFLVSYLDLEKISDTASLIWTQHPLYLPLIILGGLIMMVLEGYRLQQVLQVQGIHLHLSRLTRYVFIGNFFNNILPTSIGGDVAKGFYIARDTGKKAEPFVALVVVRIIAAVCLTAVTVIALAFGYEQLPDTTPIYMTAFMALITAGAILFFTRRRIAVKFLIVLKPFRNRKLREEIIAAYRLFHNHRHFPRQLCLAAAASLGIQFLYISINFLVARAMNFDNIDFQVFFILVPLIAVATMIPSVGGLGIREGMYIYFFSGMIGKDGAGALGLIMLVLVMAMALTGGIIFAISGSLRKARPEPPGEENCLQMNV